MIVLIQKQQSNDLGRVIKRKLNGASLTSRKLGGCRVCTGSSIFGLGHSERKRVMTFVSSAVGLAQSGSS
jgi:hypothetical protein